MITPEDIRAKVSLAFKNIEEGSADGLPASLRIVIEIVDQLLGVMTTQDAAIAELTQRIEVLERQNAEEISADATENPEGDQQATPLES